MRSFRNLRDFATHLKKINASYMPKQQIALKFLGEYLVKQSKDSIGYFLQKGAGPFETWQPLAESTVKDKQRQGVDFNEFHNPLFRTGEMRESINYSVMPNQLSVGSDSDILIYQELGTTKSGKSHIPPRSVLGMTMFKQRHVIEKVLGDFLVTWLTDKKPRRITL